MERTASATWQEFVSAILLLCGNYLIKDLDCCLQANALIDLFRSICVFGKLPYNRLFGQMLRMIDRSVHGSRWNRSDRKMPMRSFLSGSGAQS
jgi:hypothetical protein